VFFDFLGLIGSSLDEQAETFLQIPKDNGVQWTHKSIISFVNFHKQESRIKNLLLTLSVTTIALSSYFVNRIIAHYNFVEIVATSSEL
jgi:hypothetical protein